ncbi:MAG TPA: hypothetical protein VLB82_15255 [Thermodesulfobacteriota bacterium]|nr:hypothetical protein [Thermodesulfobacteriota bacterium]
MSKNDKSIFDLGVKPEDMKYFNLHESTTAIEYLNLFRDRAKKIAHNYFLLKDIQGKKVKIADLIDNKNTISNLFLIFKVFNHYTRLRFSIIKGKN